MDVRWITGFIDRPAATFDVCAAFWLAVHDAALSEPRGDTGEFATLLAPDGDAFLRVQRTGDGSAGSHLDLHVDDVRESFASARAAGATLVDDLGSLVVMRSPGGLAFCLVGHRGEQIRPAPVCSSDGSRTIVDQVTIDIAPDRFDDEVEFWQRVTGWEVAGARSPEFVALVRPDAMPLRILMQRCGDDAVGRPTECHLDLSCDDVERAETVHLELGATLIARHRFWTVMADPSGAHYCLTRRNPETGLLPPGS